MPLTTITAETFFEGSVVEAPVTVTVPPVGMVIGAVKSVREPPAVWLKVNSPQAPALEHATLQSTPALSGSFATVAASIALVPLVRAGGGGSEVKVTETTVPVPTVTFADANRVASFAAVAVIVTVPSAGTDF